MQIPKSILDQIIWDRRIKDTQEQPKPLGIQDQVKQCPDCNRMLNKNRTVKVQIYPEHSGVVVQRCGVCKKTRNPSTGEFDLPQTTIPRKILTLLKNDK